MSRVYIYEGEVVLDRREVDGYDVGDAIELVDELGESGEETAPLAHLVGRGKYIETPTLAQILELEFGDSHYIGSSKFHRPDIGERSLGRLRITAEYPCWPDPD